MKVSFGIYADTESLIKKIYTCYKNWKIKKIKKIDQKRS